MANVSKKLENDALNNGQISQLQQDIINNFQRDFPLVSSPYTAIAEKLSTQHNIITEKDIFSALLALDDQGVTSRIGPVFDHKKAGASTLAALAVKEEELDKIASIVNQFDQVNHNYARSSHYEINDYNLWFVVTASDPVTLNNTLTRIELLTGLPVLVLPMEASYHLDLAFGINITGQASPSVNTEISKVATDKVPALSEIQKTQLRKCIEAGLPKVLNPYQVIAKDIKSTELQVLAQIESWHESGLIRRFGLVVKHRKLGYNANAMVVWNIKSEHVDAVAAKLAKRAEVSLCYRRPRRADWPYNLFCMIHGTDKGFVLQQINDLTEQLSLTHIEKDILFSFKAYKQKGASYLKNKKTTTRSEVAHG